MTEPRKPLSTPPVVVPEDLLKRITIRKRPTESHGVIHVTSPLVDMFLKGPPVGPGVGGVWFSESEVHRTGARTLWLTGDTSVGPRTDEPVAVADMDEALALLAEFRELAGQRSQATRAALLEDLVRGSVAAVEPASLDQARRDAARRHRLLGTPTYSYSTLAEVRGDNSLNATRTWVSRQVTKGLLFTVPHDGHAVLPAFQFDTEGRPRAELAQLIGPLARAGMGPWQLWVWLTSPNPMLDGLIPEQAAADLTMAGEAAAAAADMAEQVGPRPQGE